MARVKKGNVPITILVIGVFVVCIIALVSFFAFNISLRDSFFEVGLVEEVNHALEHYSFYGEVEEDLVRRFEGGDYLYSEKVETSFWPWNEDRMVFSVKYPID